MYVHPDSLTRAPGDILYAGSHWAPLLGDVRSLLTDVSTIFALIPGSGSAPGSNWLGPLGVVGQVQTDSGAVVVGSLDVQGYERAFVSDVASESRVRGQTALQLIQSIYFQTTTTVSIGTAAFSTYVVACIAPKFGDSTIIVDAEVAGFTAAFGGSAVSGNLCRDPNGTPVVLTNSNPADPLGQGSATVNGQITGHFMYQEVSPGSGAALVYGIRLKQASAGQTLAQRGAIRVQEWR